MKVMGYDPYISVDAAWGLSRLVNKAISLDILLSECDYISLHVPLNNNTKGLINKEKINIMKDNVKIMNFARGGLVNNEDLIAALNEKKVACYVSDFPDEDLLDIEGVIPIPHLGASTPESEENCAIMAVKQIMDYLENGNINNSVNFPASNLARSANYRITITNKNVPNIIGQITYILADKNINIADMLNKSYSEYAYTIIDTDERISADIIEDIQKIDGVIMVRVLN
jgi:D-3-phosphoglycerate dehydrogenase